VQKSEGRRSSPRRNHKGLPEDDASDYVTTESDQDLNFEEPRDVFDRENFPQSPISRRSRASNRTGSLLDGGE